MPTNDPTPPRQPGWKSMAVIAFFAGILTVVLVVLVL